MNLAASPFPTEEKLLKIVARDVTMASGRIVNVRMSQWHWEVLAIIDGQNEDRFPDGMLPAWFAVKENVTDRAFSDSVMLILRDCYEQYRKLPWPKSEKKQLEERGRK